MAAAAGAEAAAAPAAVGGGDCWLLPAAAEPPLANGDGGTCCAAPSAAAAGDAGACCVGAAAGDPGVEAAAGAAAAGAASTLGSAGQSARLLGAGDAFCCAFFPSGPEPRVGRAPCSTLMAALAAARAVARSFFCRRTAQASGRQGRLQQGASQAGRHLGRQAGRRVGMQLGRQAGEPAERPSRAFTVGTPAAVLRVLLGMCMPAMAAAAAVDAMIRVAGLGGLSSTTSTELQPGGRAPAGQGASAAAGPTPAKQGVLQPRCAAGGGATQCAPAVVCRVRGRLPTQLPLLLQLPERHPVCIACCAAGLRLLRDFCRRRRRVSSYGRGRSRLSRCSCGRGLRHELQVPGSGGLDQEGHRVEAVVIIHPAGNRGGACWDPGCAYCVGRVGSQAADQVECPFAIRRAGDSLAGVRRRRRALTRAVADLA